MQQGPFAPRALPRFLATTSLAAAVSSSADFPGGPVIRLTCSTDGSVGRGRFHQLLDMPLSPCCPYPPRRSDMSRQSVCATPCSLRPTIEGSASGQIFFSRPPLGSRMLRPGDSLTVPRTALSVGFIRFVSSANATQATGIPTIAHAGLSPAEHASLRWSHYCPKTRSTLHRKVCF